MGLPPLWESGKSGRFIKRSFSFETGRQQLGQFCRCAWWVWDKNGPLLSPSFPEELPTGAASPFTASRTLPSLLRRSAEVPTYWSLLSSWPLDTLARPFMRPQSRPPCHRYLVEIPGPFQRRNKENMLGLLSPSNTRRDERNRLPFLPRLPINPTYWGHNVENFDLHLIKDKLDLYKP